MRTVESSRCAKAGFAVLPIKKKVTSSFWIPTIVIVLAVTKNHELVWSGNFVLARRSFLWNFMIEKGESPF